VNKEKSENMNIESEMQISDLNVKSFDDDDNYSNYNNNNNNKKKKKKNHDSEK
jgi:hypothetical protein